MNVKRTIIFSALSVVVLIAISGLLPSVFFFGKMSYESVREHLHRISFNSASWRDEKQVNSEDPVRIRMVDDLIRSRRLDRLTRPELEQLLGKSSTTNYFKEYDFVYWLGPQRGPFKVDDEWLVIKLDRRGVVEKYAIVRD